MKQVVIVIPVYKEIMNANELVSFRQLCKILGDYPIVLVCPHSLNIEEYYKWFPQIRVERFENKYFVGINGYNKLLLSVFFYQRFDKYEFILIYQLDAYVFKDDLQYWCERKFDYIGAPWLQGWEDGAASDDFTSVGNGGFSLRNVNTAQLLLKRIRILKKLRAFWYASRLQSLIHFENLVCRHRKLFFLQEPKRINEIIFDSDANEDYWWTQMAGKIFAGFQVADINSAVAFSFEVNPRQLYKVNNEQLPLGCHAWEKYEPEFWKDFIPVLEH